MVIPRNRNNIFICPIPLEAEQFIVFIWKIISYQPQLAQFLVEHVLHPEPEADSVFPDDLCAKVLKSLAICPPSHRGQEICIFFDMTSCSNVFPHSLHAYSNMGINSSPYTWAMLLLCNFYLNKFICLFIWYHVYINKTGGPALLPVPEPFLKRDHVIFPEKKLLFFQTQKNSWHGFRRGSDCWGCIFLC